MAEKMVGKMVGKMVDKMVGVMAVKMAVKMAGEMADLLAGEMAEKMVGETVGYWDFGSAAAMAMTSVGWLEHTPDDSWEGSSLQIASVERRVPM